MHIIPHNLLSNERMWAHSYCLTPPTGQEQVPKDEALGGCCDEFVRGLGHRLPVNFGVAGPLSSYNVIIYLFCIELVLYSKDVTFGPVPWFIICVRLGPSTPGDYVRARVLVPRNTGVTYTWKSIIYFVVFYSFTYMKAYLVVRRSMGERNRPTHFAHGVRRWKLEL
jgi:hypothetical protein